jgi:adenylate cyclase
MDNFLKGFRGRALALGLAAFGLIALLSLLPWGQALENPALNFCYRLRPALPPPADLLIVGIDEASFQEMRRPWPWPRRFHAELVNRLAAAGARLIVFDVLFADPTTPEDDHSFAAAIGRAGNVILAHTIEVSEDPHFLREIQVEPLELFRRAARSMALTMVTPDADGVVRRFRFRLGGQMTMPGVVAEIVRPQAGIPPDLSGLINYVGPPGSLDTVSYYQLLDDGHPLPESRIRDRIVLIGRMTETSLDLRAKADAFFTPYRSETGQLMSGVEVHGHIIHTLLTETWGRELPWAFRLLLYFGATLLFSFLMVRLSPLAGLAVLSGLIFLMMAASALLFLRWNHWAPPVLLSLGLALSFSGNALTTFIRDAREKRWLRQAFGRYVSPQVVDILSQNPERLELGGEEVEVTVLFADLAGFSALSEHLAPKVVIHLLNEYFGALTQVILTHYGTVDKYIGDALMAFWGAPLPRQDHAVLACRAALEMQRAMVELQAGWHLRGLPPLTARIGIHSGAAVAGNVGSRDRFNYTVMGDTVNLAFRLEGVNKHYGSEILLSQATRDLAGDAFLVRELDLVKVKGREQPVTIYQLLGPSPAEGEPAGPARFAAGLAAYRAQDWSQAADRFQQALQETPDDFAARLFLKRCRHYLKHPPPPDWQGVYVMKEK